MLIKYMFCFTILIVFLKYKQFQTLRLAGICKHKSSHDQCLEVIQREEGWIEVELYYDAVASKISVHPMGAVELGGNINILSIWGKRMQLYIKFPYHLVAGYQLLCIGQSSSLQLRENLEAGIQLRVIHAIASSSWGKKYLSYLRWGRTGWQLFIFITLQMTHQNPTILLNSLLHPSCFGLLSF